MKNTLKTWALTCLLALTLSGCQPVTDTGAGMGATAATVLSNLMIHAHDYTYDLPKQVIAGIVRITVLGLKGPLDGRGVGFIYQLGRRAILRGAAW
ncbi:MAG: hypothetical protein R3C14_31375 [Caldilineaceae bacterium]